MFDPVESALSEIEKTLQEPVTQVPTRPRIVPSDRVGAAIVAQATARQALHMAEEALHLANMELIRAEDEVRQHRVLIEGGR